MAIEKVTHYCTSCKKLSSIERDFNGYMTVSKDPMTCPKCKSKLAYPLNIGMTKRLSIDDHCRVEELEQKIKALYKMIKELKGET